jgi:hypothetical protein
MMLLTKPVLTLAANQEISPFFEIVHELNSISKCSLRGHKDFFLSVCVFVCVSERERGGMGEWVRERIRVCLLQGQILSMKMVFGHKQAFFSSSRGNSRKNVKIFLSI